MGYERCPNCGSISVAPLSPSPGATYVLTEVNVSLLPNS